MHSTSRPVYPVFLLTAAIVLADHALKLWVHFNIEYGFSIPVIRNFFTLAHVLNPGIAFGIEMGFPWGKLLLSLVRILAAAGLIWFIVYQNRQGAPRGLIWTLGIVLGGAIGNMIDSVFYGVLLDGNALNTAVTPWFHGQVIDMLHFKLFSGVFPDWFPFWGGEDFEFFRPVFNIADASISVGFVILLLKQNKFFPRHEAEKANQEAPVAEGEPAGAPATEAAPEQVSEPSSTEGATEATPE